MSSAKYLILGTALCFVSATQSWAQVSTYGTETIIGSSAGYTSNSSSIDLDISITIDDISSQGDPFPSNTPTPFGMEGLTVNGKVIDTAADCTWQGNRTLNCAHSYVLTTAERNSPSLTFSGKFWFDASFQPAPNAPDTFVLSNGQNLRSIPLTLNRSVGANPNCTTEADPLMPTTTNPGNFVFILNAAGTCTNQIFWIDPPVASGYNFEVTGSSFTKVKMPSLSSVNDTDGYEIQTPSNANPTQFLLAGEEHTFVVPTASFTILGINPALTLDPNDSQAFPAGIELTPPTGSQVTITQTPITEEYPPLNPVPQGLFGDDITIQWIAPQNSKIVTVNDDLELESLGLHPFDEQHSVPRWNIDVEEDSIRIELLALDDPRISYGNGAHFKFLNLNPKNSSCSGQTYISNIVATTDNPNAQSVVNAASFTDNSVIVPLAPPSGVTNWNRGEWVNVNLTYGCRSTSPNLSPTASAGPDQSISGATQVNLDGSGSSDPEGDMLTYAWRQISGPTVGLAGQETAGPSFFTPNVTSATTISFELIVEDTAGNFSAAEQVDITVLPPANNATCSPWNRDALVDSLTAVQPNGAGTNYSLKHIIMGPVGNDLQAEAARLDNLYPNFKTLEIKSYISNAGSGNTPTSGGGTAAPTKARRFETPVSPAPQLYWMGEPFVEGDWYRLDTKINLYADDGDFFYQPVYPDNCLYETAYVRLDNSGSLNGLRSAGPGPKLIFSDGTSEISSETSIGGNTDVVSGDEQAGVVRDGIRVKLSPELSEVLQTEEVVLTEEDIEKAKKKVKKRWQFWKKKKD